MANSKQRKLLITGCARSGTRHIANVWRRAGLKDFHHERMGTDGTCSNMFVVDADRYPQKMKDTYHHEEDGRRADYEFENEWHQVRHPLKVITSSAYVIGNDQRRWMQQFCPELKHASLPNGKFDLHLYSMLYWLHWNQLCEKKADFSYRIEDLETKHWDAMCLALKLPEQPYPDVSKTMNRSLRWNKPFCDREAIKKAPDLTWQQIEDIDLIVTRDIIQLAEHYGYEAP